MECHGLTVVVTNRGDNTATVNQRPKCRQPSCGVEWLLLDCISLKFWKLLRLPLQQAWEDEGVLPPMDSPPYPSRFECTSRVPS